MWGLQSKVNNDTMISYSIHNSIHSIYSTATTSPTATQIQHYSFTTIRREVRRKVRWKIKWKNNKVVSFSTASVYAAEYLSGYQVSCQVLTLISAFPFTNCLLIGSHRQSTLISTKRSFLFHPLLFAKRREW